MIPLTESTYYQQGVVLSRVVTETNQTLWSTLTVQNFAFDFLE